MHASFAGQAGSLSYSPVRAAWRRRAAVLGGSLLSLALAWGVGLPAQAADAARPAAALAAATKQDYLPLTATGWADTTRVAAGDVELWRQILSDNRPHVLAQLREFEKFIAAYAAALERGDEAQLAHLLQQGKRHRDAVGS